MIARARVAFAGSVGGSRVVEENRVCGGGEIKESNREEGKKEEGKIRKKNPWKKKKNKVKGKEKKREKKIIKLN